MHSNCVTTLNSYFKVQCLKSQMYLASGYTLNFHNGDLKCHYFPKLSDIVFILSQTKSPAEKLESLKETKWQNLANKELI